MPSIGAISVRLGWLLYDLLVELAVTGMASFEALHIAAGRGSAGSLRQRLGAALKLAERPDVPRVVLHAVSVGEVAAAEALLRAGELGRDGRLRVVLTTGTNEGLVAARRLAAVCPQIEAVTLLPWDRRRVLRRWLGAIGPAMVIVVETELWPGLFRAAAELGVRICVASGRLYPRDVWRYRLIGGFVRDLLGRVTWIGVQDEVERRRFLAIGAPAERVATIGNLKVDREMPAPVAPATSEGEAGGLVLAASTHAPEEELLCRAYARSTRDLRGLRLVLAPRHPARAADVVRRAKRHGRAALASADAGAPIVVVDVIGELASWYGRADVVFVGGTLARRGGHNPLEAAAAARAILIGPHHGHFAGFVGALVEAGAARVVRRSELTAVLVELMRDTATRQRMGSRAHDTWRAGRGVAVRYTRELTAILEASSARPGSPASCSANNART